MLEAFAALAVVMPDAARSAPTDYDLDEYVKAVRFRRSEYFADKEAMTPERTAYFLRISACQDAGYGAAMGGLPESECPFDGSELQSAWLVGYRRATTSTINRQTS